jgi:Uma2 family endonuclease
MSTGVAGEKKVWTTEELLALPDDGVERWLSRGRLRESHVNPEDPEMTKRNRFHSVTEGRVTAVLAAWLRTQPEPRGEVVCGEAGFILRRNPDTTVGIDVAVISAAMADASPEDTTMFDGHPLLAVEILSPYDMQEDWLDKVDDYLAFGTPLVWVIEPRRRTVTVYRPDAEPELFNRTHTLSADPVLPGFSCPVADLFR